MLYRRYPDVKDLVLAVLRFWMVSPTCSKAFAEKDFHAGWLETSLILSWRPDLVRKGRTTDSPAVMAMFRKDQDAYLKIERPFEHDLVVPRRRQNPKVRVGVMGDPKRADARIGDNVTREVVAGLAEFIRKLDHNRSKPKTNRVRART
jgi:creatinine amidohydrolase/Fe(II)-dependent formamide hydrolase-like protein